jgi:hypothetical protein
VGGFLRFVAWFVLLVAGFVLVGLPLLVGPLLAGTVRDMGVRADSVEVSVALFDPGLILGRSRQVTIDATNVDMAPATIGSFHLGLGNVSYFERSFETVSGNLGNVSLAMSNDTVSATSATLAGTADEATITARFAPDQVEQLLKVAAAREGLSLQKVTVTSGGVRVTVHDVEAEARLLVRGGALLIDPGVGGPQVLLQPKPSDPWQLTDVWFSDGGMNLSGTIDVADIARGLAPGS